MAVNPRVIAWAVAASVAIATPFIAPWEGKKNDPYLDIVGIPTVCYGETRVEMRRYTDAECMDMLQPAVEGFAKDVLTCTPGLAHHPYQLAAATSLTYNIGSGAYCRSTVAKRFNAGDLRGGCAAFALFNGATYSKPQPNHNCRQLKDGRWFCEVQGLINRRKDEVGLCMVGL